MKSSLFQTILLVVFGVGALIGIFVFATQSGGGNSAATTIGTVKIWGTLPEDGISAALAAAGLSNQDLQGVTYVEKSPQTFDADLKSAIAEGSGPDMILINQEDLVSVRRVITEIPSSTLPASDFSATFADEGALFYAADGSGAFGVPYLIDPLILYYNRTILSSNGIALPPATWEVMTNLAPKVTTKTQTGSITKSLIALGSYTNVGNARAILSAFGVGDPFATLVYVVLVVFVVLYLLSVVGALGTHTIRLR